MRQGSLLANGPLSRLSRKDYKGAMSRVSTIGLLGLKVSTMAWIGFVCSV